MAGRTENSGCENSVVEAIQTGLPKRLLSRPRREEGGTPKGILAFTKDAYGEPYIPGSSLKGMIRTALLCYEVKQNPEKYGVKLRDISDAAQRGGNGKFSFEETDNLETEVFHTRHMTDKKQNAVNSCMAGLIVSDSKSISTKQLTLSQKIDYTEDGKEHPLPILREAGRSLRTEIQFELTIDEKICCHILFRQFFMH